uniref:Uncharacterized protein n=1 Tax=uncultured marine microorganism HF4000_APKG8L7 TaxID=455556 RepID=B3TB68_9ZZZZ|nr:hypothetical protein ALOHA_HF4000APKG8L7ctg1g2 [uncultured marine microorganism HF4000_APKG8L7]
MSRRICTVSPPLSAPSLSRPAVVGPPQPGLDNQLRQVLPIHKHPSDDAAGKFPEPHIHELHVLAQGRLGEVPRLDGLVGDGITLTRQDNTHR